MTKKMITVSPSRLGDTIFCTPLLRFFKTYIPDLSIDVIVLTPLAKEVLQNSPYINHIFYQPEIEGLRQFSKAYDYVVNMHQSPSTDEYLAIFDKKPICYSTNYAHDIPQADKLIKFFGEQFSINNIDFDPHYDLFPTEQDQARVKQCLVDVNLEEEILIGLHMGCHGLSKKRRRLWGRFDHKKAWPLKRFIALAKKLQKTDARVRFVLTGSRAEVPLGEIFCKKIPSIINLIDKTSVLELAALMDFLKLFISNDTGALHVACASHVPVIALFGPGDPIANGPFPRYDNRIVIQKNPITRITVDNVFQQIRSLSILCANCL